MKNYQSEQSIILSSYFGERSKYLFLAYSLAFIAIGSACLKFIISETNFKELDTVFVILLLIFLGISIVSFIAAYRFLARVFTKELFIITGDEIQITKTRLFKRNTRVFKLSGISNFKHIQTSELTKHPLAGNSFDYFGFETEQKVINEMHGDNCLSFIYNNKLILFGDNVYVWQFEDLKKRVKDITGKDI